ncbi:MAG: GvpL/GvpF family gas vesicle protein [Proteobacteria bacterium]|nr:GvpL/GvpF family gas vesicle protein [Pseudomonadota bacterium]
MTEEGQYIYAIVAADEERNFGSIGIGRRNDDVSTVCYRDIGAVISPSLIMKYPVSRANTIAHQKVMEEAMKYYPVLPVRFGTVGERTGLIKEKVLKARYDELKKLLGYVEDKIELGLKALWLNMQAIYKEIIDENGDIRSLRDRIMSKAIKPQRDQIRLGEIVKKTLDAKRMQDEKAILDPLKGLWVDHKVNNGFGDQMVTNSSFLVTKDREKKFDDAVDKLSTKYDGRMKFKYVGPVPPCNFIEIVVKW